MKPADGGHLQALFFYHHKVGEDLMNEQYNNNRLEIQIQFYFFDFD